MTDSSTAPGADGVDVEGAPSLDPAAEGATPDGTDGSLGSNAPTGDAGLAADGALGEDEPSAVDDLEDEGA